MLFGVKTDPGNIFIVIRGPKKDFIFSKKFYKNLRFPSLIFITLKEYFCIIIIN